MYQLKTFDKIGDANEWLLKAGKFILELDVKTLGAKPQLGACGIEPVMGVLLCFRVKNITAAKRLAKLR